MIKQYKIKKIFPCGNIDLEGSRTRDLKNTTAQNFALLSTTPRKQLLSWFKKTFYNQTSNCVNFWKSNGIFVVWSTTFNCGLKWQYSLFAVVSVICVLVVLWETKVLMMCFMKRKIKRRFVSFGNLCFAESSHDAM